MLDLAIPTLIGAASGTTLYLLDGHLSWPAALIMGISIGLAYALGEARGERSQHGQ